MQLILNVQQFTLKVINRFINNIKNKCFTIDKLLYSSAANINSYSPADLRLKQEK